MITVTQTSLVYLEQVETFFLAQCGRGLMVSPADAQLVGAWEEAGVPADVVCRGLARAFAARRGDPRRFSGDSPRSIRACQAFVEVEVQAWRSRAVGRNDWGAASASPSSAAPSPRLEQWLAELLGRIEAEGPRAADPARGYWRRAWRGVRDLHASVQRDRARLGGVPTALAALESQLLAELLAGLAPIEAVDLRRSAEGRVRLARAEVSARAFAAAVQHALEEELRARFGLFPLVPETL